MTNSKAFVDTNILLRAVLSRVPLHDEAEAMIQRMLDQDVELWISRQVIREYLVQATHPRTFSPPLAIDQVVYQLAMIEGPFRVADDTGAVTAQLLALLQTYPTRGKQIHDANIVATMLTYDITVLLTLNVADFRRFEDRITILSLTN